MIELTPDEKTIVFQLLDKWVSDKDISVTERLSRAPYVVTIKKKLEKAEESIPKAKGGQ